MPQHPRKIVVALLAAAFGGVCFLGAAAVYEEPTSFYVNFVLLPTLILMAIGTVADLTAIGLALTSLRGATRKPALIALAIATLVPIVSIATIQLIQRV
ncbi:MAG TPA: hypothetical protein DD490_11160 [Acidobacteria bacterium]|nr:hypothetical protein [Acidobacteriota bacterium]